MRKKPLSVYRKKKGAPKQESICYLVYAHGDVGARGTRTSQTHIQQSMKVVPENVHIMGFSRFSELLYVTRRTDQLLTGVIDSVPNKCMKRYFTNREYRQKMIKNVNTPRTEPSLTHTSQLEQGSEVVKSYNMFKAKMISPEVNVPGNNYIDIRLSWKLRSVSDSSTIPPTILSEGIFERTDQTDVYTGMVDSLHEWVDCGDIQSDYRCTGKFQAMYSAPRSFTDVTTDIDTNLRRVSTFFQLRTTHWNKDIHLSDIVKYATDKHPGKKIFIVVRSCKGAVKTNTNTNVIPLSNYSLTSRKMISNAFHIQDIMKHEKKKTSVKKRTGNPSRLTRMRRERLTRAIGMELEKEAMQRQKNANNGVEPMNISPRATTPVNSSNDVSPPSRTGRWRATPRGRRAMSLKLP